MGLTLQVARAIYTLHKWWESEMATPGELVQTMANVLGVPRPTVFQYDRTLAEHGLRSKKGRGPSAATVTARDAANLLIAALATPVSGWSMKEAARACEAYASLPTRVEPARERNATRVDWLALLNLPRRHSFGDALAALIEASGRLEAFNMSKARPRHARLRVSLEGPLRRAEIVSIMDGKDAISETSRSTRRLIYGDRKRIHGNRDRRDDAFGDLTLKGSITFFTIFALGSLLNEEREAR